MKLIIPAAGIGVRFVGGGVLLPKCLIPVSGRPLISYLLRMASASGQITQVVIILGPHYEAVLETIQELASSIRWKSPTEITCLKNPDFANTNSIYSIYLARDFLEGDVVIHDSDVLISPQLFETLTVQDTQNVGWVLNERMRSIPEDETKVVTDSKDQVIQIGENEIPSAIAHGRYIGVSNLGSEASKIFRDEIESLVHRGTIRSYYTVALKALSARKMLYATWANNQPWFEIDTLDDLRSVDPSAMELITQQLSRSKNRKMKAAVKSLGSET